MNARLKIPNHTHVISPIPPWDSELERNALGLALLGRPFPPWLVPEHFYPLEHQLIFEAARELRNVSLVAARLRSEGKLAQLNSNGIKSSELAAMCLEAEHAERMGWAVEFEQLRELWRVRGLLATMERCAIKLRGGGTHDEAVNDLREHVRSCK